MSDSNQNIRILLGPVAQSLIEGTNTNRPRALDNAIAELQEQAGNGQTQSENGAASSDAPRSPSAEIMPLKAEIRGMRRALVELKEIALAEMRMTRLLVGTLVNQSDEDHAALLRFAGSMIQKMYENSELLTREDQQDLERSEELFNRLNRMELERAVEVVKNDGREEELER